MDASLAAAPRTSTPTAPLKIALPFRPPFDFDALLGFFARRAIPGIEAVDATSYARVLALADGPAWLRVTRGNDALALELSLPNAAALPQVVAKVRRVFDLDADAAAIDAVLGRQRALREAVRRHPGQRVPGAWDGFELAVRAVLGQQVTVAAARTFARRLVDHVGAPLGATSARIGGPACGRPVAHVGAPLGATDARIGGTICGRPVAPEGAPTSAPPTPRLFPTAEALADADLRAIGLTTRRAATLRGLARAIVEGRLDLDPRQPLDTFVQRCCALDGIGPWTAHYIALRLLDSRDAFPAADLVLRQVVARGGALPSARELEALSQAWRPWRSYAVLHLWRMAP